MGVLSYKDFFAFAGVLHLQIFALEVSLRFHVGCFVFLCRYWCFKKRYRHLSTTLFVAGDNPAICGTTALLIMLLSANTHKGKKSVTYYILICLLKKFQLSTKTSISFGLLCCPFITFNKTISGFIFSL